MEKLIDKLKKMDKEELKNYIDINMNTIKEGNLSAETKSKIKKTVEKAREILIIKEEREG